MSLRSPPLQAYGGYLATMLLSSEEFTQLKCGAAVSPITDFQIYGITFRHTFPIMPRSPQPFSLRFCVAASAFSERYLGSKTDSRAYTVRARRHLPSDAGTAESGMNDSFLCPSPPSDGKFSAASTSAPAEAVPDHSPHSRR